MPAVALASGAKTLDDSGVCAASSGPATVERPVNGVGVLPLLLLPPPQAVSESDVAKYVELKRLLQKDDTTSRNAFKQLYTRYYGMNTAGLTDTFRQRYFDLLFAFDAKTQRSTELRLTALFDCVEFVPYEFWCLSWTRATTPKPPGGDPTNKGKEA